MNKEKIGIIESTDGLLADVRSMIEQTRGQVAQTVNAGMTLLYWKVGKRIQTEVLAGGRAEYGKAIVATLSRQLSWSHFRELLPLDQPFKREFYAEMCRVERWSVRTLRELLQEKLHAAIEISRARLEANK